MNIVLWVVQILLAVHTAIGAVWKFSNPVQAMPSLTAIPPGVWMAISVVELAVSLALVAPLVHRPLGALVPFAAAFVVLVMLAYTGLHLASGDASRGPVAYWMVVAVVAAVVAYGRFALSPL